MGARQNGYCSLPRIQKKRLVADALRIGHYVIHLQDLYDFNLRKTRFTWVSDTSIYWNFEVKLTQMLTGEFKRPISRRMIDSYYRDTIFNRMNDWVKSKRDEHHRKVIFQFSFRKFT